MKKIAMILIVFIFAFGFEIYCESELEFLNPAAKSIVVAGDWNDWAGSAKGNLDLNNNKMVKGEDGKWRYSLSNVKQGTYEYKYIIDGKWEEGANRKVNVTPAILPVSSLEPTVKIKTAELESGTLFEIDAPTAGKVSVAGSFNDWNMNANFLQKAADGKWRTRIQLKPGTYEYKFLQDNDWDKLNQENRKITVSANSGQTQVSNQSSGLESGTLFEIDAPTAGKVSVAGSFNDWNMNANFLQKAADGKWRTRIQLKPGTYEYKFLQDSDWDKLNQDNRKITVSANSGQTQISNQSAGLESGTLFEIDAPTAGKVSVAGSFNDWNMNANFLQKAADGKWRTRIQLKPGTYEYKFLQDNDWDKLNQDNRKITVK